MSNVEEVKVRVAASAAQTRDAVAGLRAVDDQLQEALTMLRLSAVGTVHPSLPESIAKLELARQRLSEAQTLALGAVDAAEQWQTLA